MKLKSSTIKDAYIVIRCNRCRNIVCRSEVEGYEYTCKCCDEDLYKFETYVSRLQYKDSEKVSENLKILSSNGWMFVETDDELEDIKIHLDKIKVSYQYAKIDSIWKIVLVMYLNKNILE